MFAVAKFHVAGHNRLMRIAIVDESAARASVIEDGLRIGGKDDQQQAIRKAR